MPPAFVQSFTQALTSAPGTEQAEVSPFDWEKEGVPSDVGCLLSAVGGFRYFDLRFTALPDLGKDRQFWNRLATDFETGRSDTWSHAFWNPDWYPLAQSGVEVY